MMHYFLIAFSAICLATLVVCGKGLIEGFFAPAMEHSGGKRHWFVAIFLSLAYFALTALAFAWFATTVTG